MDTRKVNYAPQAFVVTHAEYGTTVEQLTGCDGRSGCDPLEHFPQCYILTDRIYARLSEDFPDASIEVWFDPYPGGSHGGAGVYVDDGPVEGAVGPFITVPTRAQAEIVALLHIQDVVRQVIAEASPWETGRLNRSR